LTPEDTPATPRPEPTTARPDVRRGRRGRGTLRRTPDLPCLNCGDPTPGNYCRNCGQAKRRVAVSVAALVTDVLEDQLVLNRALPRTLLYLIFRPGFLTVEYVNGRIVRYIAPFRLYLVSSIVFFLLLSFFGLRAIERAEVGENVTLRVDSAARAFRVSGLESIDTTGMPPEARRALRQLELLPQNIDSAAAAAGPSDSIPQQPPVPGLQPWARELAGDTTGTGIDQNLEDRIVARYGHLPVRDALREFAREYLEYVPHIVFLLLPVFALILKVLYARRKRYYAEHFVFALHVHAFTFLLFTLMFVISRAAVNAWLFFGLMLYVWVAMKRVYAQGVFRTSAKYLVLGGTYAVLVGIALVGTMFVTLLLG
jgi:hypothetical protein